MANLQGAFQLAIVLADDFRHVRVERSMWRMAQRGRKRHRR